MIPAGIGLFLMGWYLCWVTDIPRPRLSQDILGFIGLGIAGIGLFIICVAAVGRFL